MTGIANLDIAEFQVKVNRFSQQYVLDWTCWLNTPHCSRTAQFGVIMRRWQACRPNKMRRTRAENLHDAPYLEDLVQQAAQHLQVLQGFDIGDNRPFSSQTQSALAGLWDIFENLSYDGRARKGNTGVVGISKAVMLLTNGQVGPAFDSKVRRHLGIRAIDNAKEWIQSMCFVSRDIQAFMNKNSMTLQQAAPIQHATLHTGRLYDMALGPG